MGDADRTVRTVADDEELTVYLKGLMTAFLANRDVSAEWVAFARERWEFDRVWAAFDGDTQCGSTRTFASTVRLPGGTSVPVSCLTQVTVLPTHTRRGHLSRLMRTQLDAAVEAGEVASLLVAAEWPIYGRFGYGPATEWAEWEVDVAHAEMPSTPVGTCELIEPADLDEIAAELLARQQATTPGCIERRDDHRRIGVGIDVRPGDEPSKTRVRVLHRDQSGRPDGFVVYDAKEHWAGMRPESTLKVDDLVYVDDVAERELLRYLLDVDLVAKVTYPGRPTSVIRHVLKDGRAARCVGTWDHIWARILDVPACLEARSYVASDRLVLEVVDPFLGRGGRFALDASPDGASCVSTTDSPDVTLPTAALGAAWLGGADVRAIAASGSIDEHTTGGVQRTAALLKWHQPPWCATDF